MIAGQHRKLRDALVSLLLVADGSRNGLPADHLDALKLQAGQSAEYSVQTFAPFGRPLSQHWVGGLVIGQALFPWPQCAPSIMPASINGVVKFSDNLSNIPDVSLGGKLEVTKVSANCGIRNALLFD